MDIKDKAMTKLVIEHNKKGLERYKKDWLSCNFGWVVDDDSIASKVYNRRMIFISKINPRKRIIEHNEEKY